MKSLKQAHGALISCVASDILVELPEGLKCDVAELTCNPIDGSARVRFDGKTPAERECHGTIEMNFDSRDIAAYVQLYVEGQQTWTSKFHCYPTLQFVDFVRMVRVAISVALRYE